jgi:hypothetical protein
MVRSGSGLGRSLNKNGDRMREAGDLRKIREVLEAENRLRRDSDAVAQRLSSEAPSRFDLQEMFGGDCLATERAPLFGLSAIEPAELDTGWSLNTSLGATRWKQCIRKHKPLLVMIDYPRAHERSLKTVIKFQIC